MDIFNGVRLRAWKQQPEDFFDEAFIDADGTLAPSDGWCKQGVDIAYNGDVGLPPAGRLAGQHRRAAVPGQPERQPALARARRHLSRQGRRPLPPGGIPQDHLPGRHRLHPDQAPGPLGSRRRPLPLRDRRHGQPQGLAERLPDLTYSELERPPRYTIKTVPRQARERHKERIVAERQFDTLKLIGEEVAEFAYRPVACKKAYRVVVLRKKLIVEKGQLWLFEPDRYFFYITNDRTTPASEIVFLANDRCDQENLIAQLKGGVKALAMPVGDLVSNWAYMVMASLAWSLKAWSALVLPEQGRWAEKYRAEKRSLLRMEFSTFCVAMIQVPCQIVRTSRRIVYRLLSWNPWQGVFLRLVERLHGRRLC